MENVKPIQEISISDFKATCPAILDRVKRTGQPILVTKRGVPMAVVSPPPPLPRKSSWLGCMAGSVRIEGDIVSPASDEREWETMHS